MEKSLMTHYPFTEIEKKWQDYWLNNKIFKVEEDFSIPKEKRAYILDMFPYPSGNGLHVGHPEGYTATDIYARFLRANGYNVLHPMGFDSFGLPAENYAIKTKTHPNITTEANIDTFRKQIKRLGFSYDWDREIQTHTPQYYRWTQWIFLQLYKKGLAYEDVAPINWCPSCKVGLANEEVTSNNLCDRCETPVERKQLRQWKLKITAYAQKLLDDLDILNWPEPVKAMQRNWIGRSEGMNITFKVKDYPNLIVTTYTTRPETLYGVTYLVLAPEHHLVEKITTSEQLIKIQKYQDKVVNKSDLERTDLAKTKSGVFTGSYAIHPITNESIPVWIADYVLISYGSGAIMAVPAHDQRDYAFAEQYHLPIKKVIHVKNTSTNTNSSLNSETSTMINSEEWSNLSVKQARLNAINFLTLKNIGVRTVQYKLRDWIFSRQRYWGEPIPLIHCPKCGTIPLEEKDLPLKLPEVKSYTPSATGESPLANIEEWVHVVCHRCKSQAKRETNTMPQWAGSCWYYLRYIDPNNSSQFVDKEKESYWMPVHLYIGGMEHAVLHLLYARFWHKFLYDLNLVSTKEPFDYLVNQGMILGENNEKMSKSRGNIVNPDDMIDQYGADSLRLYEMFMGPLQATKPWNTRGIIGVHRFLAKVYFYAHLKESSEKPPLALEKILHKTIKKVTLDTKKLEFNTAISQMMIFMNEVTSVKICYRQIFDPFLILLAPYAPHLAEELYAKRRQNSLLSISFENWPIWQDSFIIDQEITLGVQINGKLRSQLTVPLNTNKETLESLALNLPRIKEILHNQSIHKVIAIPDKIVNIITQEPNRR